MKLCKKRPTEPKEVKIFGRISWIVDELIGIRAAEQRLSQEIGSADPQATTGLLERIQALNSRVELLDRTLDEYARPELSRLPAHIDYDGALPRAASQ